MILSLHVWKTEIRLSIRRREHPAPIVVAVPHESVKWVGPLVDSIT